MSERPSQDLFHLRPSAWLNRFEYLLLLAVLALLWFAYDRFWALGGSLLILLLALRWRASGQLLLPHRMKGALQLRDKPPRLVCYACSFDDGLEAWPLQELKLHVSRYFLLIRHRGNALLLVADSFESPAEHARFRRHLLQMLEHHAC